MNKISIKDILSATNGRLIYNCDNMFVSSIATDSRTYETGALFVAIIGENLDGHAFLEDAYNNGYRNFIIDNKHEFNKKNTNIIVVSNTTIALGDIAKFYKEKYNILYVGVTGSVGKTSTKDMIYSVLSTKYKTLKNIGNYNNEIGLPKTIFNLNEEYEACVLEMGMSYKGEIAHLSDIVEPHIAVISNIGMSHIEHFDNQDGIFNAKMEIVNNFKKDDILIVNGDDKYLKTLKNKTLNYKLLTYGFDKHNDIYCTAYEIKNEAISFTCNYHDKLYNFTIPSNAKHNILNAMSAILVGIESNISMGSIKEGLKTFSISKGRLTLIKKKNITIIDDTYNASCDSMISALEVLKSYKGRKVAILGDILESGTYAQKLHNTVGAKVPKSCDLLICVGELSKYIMEEAIKNGFPEDKTRHFNNADSLLNVIKEIIKSGDIVLLKASHGINLGKVVLYLDQTYEN